jgi:tetratricopeptide (TPR) repeat protein
MPVKNLLLIVCFFAYNTYAQNFYTVDSILNTVNVEDSSHIHQTIEALNLAKQLGYDKGEARAFHCLGFIYTMKGSFPLSMEKYLRAADLYKHIGNEEKRAVVLVNIAYVFHRMKDYEQEIKYAEEALAISKEDSIKGYAYSCLGKAKMGQ